MCECCQSDYSASSAFFDSIAEKWDSWEDLESLQKKFANALAGFGVRSDEHILDVGCGTGNLTGALLLKLSAHGRITAVDISPKMIEKAKSKVTDHRVEWVCCAVESLVGPKDLFDRIICYSVWPHLTDPESAVVVFKRMLKTNGMLHVWHLISRDAVNKIHAEADEAVSNHLLAPASQTAALLEQSGFFIEDMQDDADGYLVTGRKL